ncbi:hypothetical protein P8452_08909 [Trifolium repens]|nr:hypothetical protein P8452_08909 [Trifolium repens]
MVVVHLRATGDAPILKQSNFKVGEIISRFEKKGFYLKEPEEEVDSAENNEFFSIAEKHVQKQFQNSLSQTEISR